MDERSALAALSRDVPAAGDDAAVVDGQVLSTDMLHQATDFPTGTTRYTAGWRAVGASLSDVAAMGAQATVAVAAYGAPSLDATELRSFVDGAQDVCAAVDAEYVGGDLDTHGEFTVATTALGGVEDSVRRDGASPGEVVCVTGAFGRSAAALRAFEADDVGRGNDLFRFPPRVAAGVALAPYATSMMDSSDGFARSLHQLSEASDCGFDVEWAALPVHDAVDAYAEDATDRREMAAYFGEDFELVFTVPPESVAAVREACPVPVAVVGDVTDAGVVAGGDPVPDRGYTHADD
jgi:thiamine-monophosphate kinase